MDALFAPVCEKAIDSAVSQVVKQLGYLLHYEDNFKEQETKVNQLQGIRQMIQHRIEEEEKYGNQRESYVQDWLDRVDKLIKEAKELIEDPRRAGVGCRQWWCLDLRSRRKLSKMAKEMAENAAKLKEEGKFERVAFSPPTSYLRRSSESMMPLPMTNDMMKALKEPKEGGMIWVYGLGFVNKSTLAEQVAAKAKRDKFVALVEVKVQIQIQATVGENSLLEKIQDEIVKQLKIGF